MKALIVDDDIVSSSYLNKLCASVPGLEVVKLCSNALEAVHFLNMASVDVVFLDIEMPGFSGLELVKTFPDMPYVIFTTSKGEYAVEAFDLNACDYLQKPISLPRLQKALLKIRNLGNLSIVQRDNVFIKVDGRWVNVKLHDILYIETIGDYVLFQMSDKNKFIVHSTLSGMEKKINHPDFMKIHRSFIVNLTKIVDIDENSLVVGNKVIPISRSAKPQLMSKIKML